MEDNVGMSYIETVKEKELHFKTVLIILHPNLQVIKSHLLVQWEQNTFSEGKTDLSKSLINVVKWKS